MINSRFRTFNWSTIAGLVLEIVLFSSFGQAANFTGARQSTPEQLYILSRHSVFNVTQNLFPAKLLR
jgi:hypothetical protein